MKASLCIAIPALYIAVCAFGNPKGQCSCKSTSKDGTMEVRDTACCEGTDKDYVYGKDTLDLPYCVSYPCISKVTCNKDSVAKGPRCSVSVKRLPETEPFYLRKGVYIKLSLSSAQQKHFEAFRNKVFTGVKDTALRAEAWFALTGVEAAIKNNDAVSYMVGLTHLTDLWKKITAQ